jgi:hypothetical protein
MTRITGPQFNGGADYDCLVNIVFKDIEDFVRMKQDPYYIEKIMPDHENFADTKRSRYVALAFHRCVSSDSFDYPGCLLAGLKNMCAMGKLLISCWLEKFCSFWEIETA